MKNFIYGKNSVLEALENNFPIIRIYLLKGLENRSIKFKNITYLSMNEMNKITNGNHQGYIAEIAPFNYHDIHTILKDKPETVLILDHIQDPQNFGAIIRSSNVFGIKHIIIPKDRSVDVTPAVLKTSSGGFKNVKIIKVTSLFESIEFLKKNGFWIYATALNDKAKIISKTNFSFPVALIMGNEGSGVSKTLLKHADEIIYIKQDSEAVQSLNVSAATAVCLYEIFNQKNK
ncbi:23S rRNA (guanosine(2251)-2'-O)-methyltransferase RlmB [Mycoplasmopsis arginini]|uniref:23S rRNA (guanosine(2251)-2'-O)-methyltransferase RlmB n=1 Tax=Mycoplasmopsis arginini TaxID=2094 RepID=UPI0027376F21|nr:23S rRNA (guanosine(2251)-2'-O)-methyltransferase RlmB [Mycoplasmopsis arginini]MDP4042941.1 23S rRNA (guanosine(2251)-2'-O)-methyltransferase RlmB [Mycoplasmopsis arginini]